MSVQRVRQHSSALLLCLGLGAACVGRPDGHPLRQHPRLRARPRPGGHRPAAGRLRRPTPRPAPTSSARWPRSGYTAVEQPFDDHHARRPGEDGQPRRHAARRSGPSASSSPATTTPSCSTSSGSSAPTTAARAPASLLELARVLKARPKPTFTIELLFLDGEEADGEWRDTDHTYGSRHYVDAPRAPRARWPALKALILLDMIGDRDAEHAPRHQLDAVADRHHLGDARSAWDTAPTSSTSRSPVEDDHLPFLKAGVPSVDSSTSTTPPGTPPRDTLDKVSAGSLQVVGDVVLAALPEIEARLLKGRLSRRRPSGRLPRESRPRSAPSATPSPSRRRGRRPGRDAGMPRFSSQNSDVRLARHRADLDLLLAADQAGRHRRVDRVHQLAIALAPGLDDRRGVHAGRGAERVAPDDRIVVGNRHAGGVATPPRSTRSSVDAGRASR